MDSLPIMKSKVVNLKVNRLKSLVSFRLVYSFDGVEVVQDNINGITVEMPFLNFRKAQAVTIQRFYIVKEKRDQGFGTRILQDIIQKLRRAGYIQLNEACPPEKALSWYKRFGFKEFPVYSPEIFLNLLASRMSDSLPAIVSGKPFSFSSGRECIHRAAARIIQKRPLLYIHFTYYYIIAQPVHTYIYMLYGVHTLHNKYRHSYIHHDEYIILPVFYRTLPYYPLLSSPSLS